MKPKILITGAKGQLGYCLEESSKENYLNKFSFIWADKNILDITDKANLQSFFSSNKIDYCINCSAYTLVDLAETEKDLAFKINSEGVKNLAIECNENNVKLIHISTDYVFDGKKNTPYIEEDLTNPINVYGKSKLAGEKFVLKTNENNIVIRTSWLYSVYKNNFVKTMLKLFEIKDEISVVSDQIGSPTHALDLANAIFKIIEIEAKIGGIFHFCNSGSISWFDFANEIKSISNSKIKIKKVLTKDYPTAAKRSKYSVLDTNKISKEYEIEIKNWKNSLKEMLNL